MQVSTDLASFHPKQSPNVLHVPFILTSFCVRKGEAIKLKQVHNKKHVCTVPKCLSRACPHVVKLLASRTPAAERLTVSVLYIIEWYQQHVVYCNVFLTHPWALLVLQRLAYS